MMYKEEAAIAIKVNGKVVREISPGTIKIPFGSEYAVYFKNLSDRKCVVKVSIDGEDVLKGKQLIVDSNKSVDLERYLDSLNKGNKFKFAKMTDGVASNRGVKAEDGVIRIEWIFEKKVEPIVFTNTYWCNTYQQLNHPIITCDGGSLNARSLNNIQVGFKLGACYSAALESLGEVKTYGGFEAGFTTKGDVSNQKFSYGNIGSLEYCNHSACLYLVGSDEPIITTQEKVKCSVCGTSNKFGSKFCSECGTYIAKL